MSLALIFSAYLIALAGSLHCAGMCGPLVGMLEHSLGTDQPPLQRRVAYQLGRLTTYLIIGVLVAGFVSTLSTTSWLHNAGQGIRVASIVVVAAMGLQLLLHGRGLTAFDQLGNGLWRRAAPFARHLFPLDRIHKALLAGMLWGLLPCGLVYGAAALAATSASVLVAAGIMTAFWAGTLPSLLALGFGLRHARSPAWRPIAALSLLLVAGFSTWTMLPGHGRHHHHAPQEHDHAAMMEH